MVIQGNAKGVGEAITTEHTALVALIAAVFAFCIATATAVLDLWVWVRVSKICRDAAEAGKKEETK